MDQVIFQIVKNLYRRIRFEKRTLIQRILFHIKDQYTPHPDKIYWINPDKIVYHTNYTLDSRSEFKDRVFNTIRDRGKVCDGDWDISDFKFIDLDVFKAIKQRISENIDWRTTEYYKKELSQIIAGKRTWGCKNKNDWEKHCRKIDALINSIKTNGYQKNFQLNCSNILKKLFLKEAMLDHITVNIGRTGRYLFQDGRHRLAIAKVLNISLIPVKVLVRHKEWVDLRKNILFFYKSKNSFSVGENLIPIPLEHPDFNDIHFLDPFKNEFEIIQKNLKMNSGIVIDTGVGLGYFCHKFENLGFECIGIEKAPFLGKLCKQLKKAENKKFKVVIGQVFDQKVFKEIKKLKIDCIIGFNLFNDFINSDIGFENCMKLLSNLNFNTFLIGFDYKSSNQDIRSRYDFSIEKLKRNLLKDNCSNRIELLMEKPDGTKIYKITKLMLP